MAPPDSIAAGHRASLGNQQEALAVQLEVGENAVTALKANGIRAVIAPSIADIHYNNCIKNGVLPVRLSSDECAALRRQLRESPGSEIAIDLDSQSLTGPDQTRYAFEIDSFDKYRLLNGLDDIGLTRALDDKIESFAKDYATRHRWTALPSKAP